MSSFREPGHILVRTQDWEALQGLSQEMSASTGPHNFLGQGPALSGENQDVKEHWLSRPRLDGQLRGTSLELLEGEWGVVRTSEALNSCSNGYNCFVLHIATMRVGIKCILFCRGLRYSENASSFLKSMALTINHTLSMLL